MGALLALVLAWRDLPPFTPTPRPLRHGSTAEARSVVVRRQSLLSSGEFFTSSSLTHVFPLRLLPTGPNLAL